MKDTILQLQAKSVIPELLAGAQKPPQKGKKGKKGGNQNQKNNTTAYQEIQWDFDSKEHAREKYGNFNTPILIKLCSKYNKLAQKVREE